VKRLPHVLVTLALALWALPSVASASATTTYTAVVTVSPPPTSSYVGDGGGDGWGLGFMPDKVFNVFHHAPTLQVECHLQVDATVCPTNGALNWPVTITDASGGDFAVQAQPSLWVDQVTGRLYVYATQVNTLTAGVVCVDTNANVANPYCGFTPLSAAGDAPLQNAISNISDGVIVGTNFYAVNFTSSLSQTPGANAGTENTLMCFSLTTFAGCAGRPFPLALGTGVINVNSYPSPSITAVGSRIIVPFSSTQGNFLACFDTTTIAPCTGTWPASVADAPSSGGAGVPILNASGTPTGYCTRNGLDCVDVSGAAIPAPGGFTMSPGQEWAGPPVVIGTRVYTTAYVGTADGVDCFDFATNATCAHYPLALANFNLAYSINADPNRAGCLWVNSDDGTGQIQNFDAITTGGCGTSGERVLVSQFVAPSADCAPTTYQSLQILSPSRSQYASGTVQFQDASGTPLPQVPTLTLDNAGSVSLTQYALSTASALPQALISLNGPSVTGLPVTVQLTWAASSASSCDLKPTPVSTIDDTLTHNPDDSVTATLHWTAPISDGNDPISHYTATALPGGATCTSSALTCQISGLSAGTNYTFTVTATNSVGTSAPTSTAPVTVPHSYLLTYHAGTGAKGKPPVSSSTPNNAGTVMTVAGAGTLTKTGSVFGGWSTGPNATGTIYQPGATFAISATTDLYPVWRAPCTVTFSNGSGTKGRAPASPSHPTPAGGTILAPGQGSLTKVNAVFTGWSTSSSGGVLYPTGTAITITKSTTLYPQWAPLFKVTYASGTGVTGAAPSDPNGPYRSGATVTVVGGGTLSLVGFTFVGWNTSANGTGTSYAPGASLVITKSITLYPQWASNFYSLLGAAPRLLSGTSLVITTSAGSGTGAVSYKLTGDTTGGTCSLHGNTLFADSPGVCTVTVSKAKSASGPAQSFVLPVTVWDN